MAKYYLIYGSSQINIDDYFIKINLGLPSRSITQSANLGDGSTVRGSGAFSGREISLTVKFKGAQETTRDLILGWFSMAMYKTVYLYKEITGFTGVMECKLSPSGGESYSSYSISDEVPFKLITKQAFFEKTTQATLETITVTSTSRQTETVTVTGQPVFPQFQFTATADFTLFQIMLSYRWGFRIDRQFYNGDVIIIDTRNGQLSLTVNDVSIYNAFTSTSTPFLLDTGDNSIDIFATSGELLVKSYERRL
jgi:hypothetical protein